MWIFLNDSFLSIVGDRNDPKSVMLLVRARVAGDIERVFPDAKVTRTPNRDYLFRAWVPRGVVASAITRAVDAIDYSNFKDSIPRHDHERHDAYLGVWQSMYRLQRQLNGRRPTEPHRVIRPKPSKAFVERHPDVERALDQPRTCPKVGCVKGKGHEGEHYPDLR